jgi:hypothetical protein
MDGSSLDYRILPYIGNGHIATVVYNDVIYMNGLYNGHNGLYIYCFCFFGVYIWIKGSSHRARIPSTVNWQFKINSSSSLYTLNVSSGKKFFLIHF